MKLNKKAAGASMVEYAILVAIIAAVAIAGLTGLKAPITAAFTNVANAITGVNSGNSSSGGN